VNHAAVPAAELVICFACDDDTEALLCRESQRVMQKNSRRLGDEIVHCIEPVNAASQGVARRLGARKDREGELFGKPADIWVTSRASWAGQN
jgi:hypothetical protein